MKFTVTMARSVPGSVAWETTILNSGDLERGKTIVFHGGLSSRESTTRRRTVILTVSVAVDAEGSNVSR